MKRIVTFLGLASAAYIHGAAIEQVVVRQQWPWSTDVKVEYKISGVTKPVDLKVTAYNGDVLLDQSNLDASITGRRLGIEEDGVGEFTIDPVKAFGTDKAAIANFKVKLDVVDTSESMSKVLYKIIDLTSGEIDDVTTADLLSGGYGAVETGGQTITPAGDIDETKVYWTGVTNEDVYATTSIVLRRVPSGGKTYKMGAAPGEIGNGSGYTYANWSNRGKETQHEVSFQKDFFIGVYEITQKQYNLLTSKWPSNFKNTAYRNTRPVEKVSWDMATGTFLPALNTLTKKTFILPTEAQWEYAYRAGTTTGLYSGKDVLWDYRDHKKGLDTNVDPLGRYVANAGGTSPENTADTTQGTAKVGSYQCNNWGIYDMLGNVREWCSDYFQEDLGSEAQTDPQGPETGTLRVVRNSSWAFAQNANGSCRAAFRAANGPTFTGSNTGFRIALMAE